MGQSTVACRRKHILHFENLYLFRMTSNVITDLKIPSMLCMMNINYIHGQSFTYNKHTFQTNFEVFHFESPPEVKFIFLIC